MGKGGGGEGGFGDGGQGGDGGSGQGKVAKEQIAKEKREAQGARCQERRNAAPPSARKESPHLVTQAAPRTPGFASRKLIYSDPDLTRQRGVDELIRASRLYGGAAA